MAAIRISTAALLPPLLGLLLRLNAMRLGSAALMFCALVQPLRADVIELRAHHWCPYHCRPGSDLPGLLVDLTREALAPFGHEINYALLNRSRSLAQVYAGEINGILGTHPGEHPELLFAPALAHSQEALGFRSGEARQVSDPQELQGLRLGALQDQGYSEGFAAYLGRNKTEPTRVQLLAGEDGLQRNLKKLLNDRIDLVLEDRAVLLHMLKRQRLRRQVEVVTLPGQIPLHIGFAPGLDSSARYIAQLQEGLERLRHSGRYGEILARYGVEE